MRSVDRLGPNRQQGAVAPFVAVSLLALLAVAGFALDSSHTLANKTRTQNTVDAAALAAAKVYDETLGNIAEASAAANSLFSDNAAAGGNHELNDAGITPQVQFSPTLTPFVSSGIGPYVRVRASGFEVATSLTSLLGISAIEVSASAVAGPSPTLNETCNLAPIIVCSEDLADDNFGFEPTQIGLLKTGDQEDIGPGNFKLLDLGCSQGGGGSCVRQHMAGEASVCKSPGDNADTKPGQTAGPSLQGLNTRFGSYQGGGVNSTDHPPDVNTTEPGPNLTTPTNENDADYGKVFYQGTEVEYADEAGADFYSYDEYTDDISAPGFTPPAGSEFGRRVMALPVTACTGVGNGQSSLPVHGFVCFFILQEISGGPSNDIFGEYVEACGAGGTPGINPGSGSGPYRIQLYRDPDSTDS